MTVEGMKLQSLWYFIGGLPQFQQMTRPFPGIPESVKTKFSQHDYSIWTQHQGEAIFGFNSKMTTEEFHKSVHKVHIEHLNMIPKHLQTQFCNSKDENWANLHFKTSQQNHQLQWYMILFILYFKVYNFLIKSYFSG